MVGVRRLSQMPAATTSPERQWDNVLAAVKAVGGHVMAWVDDWEVSGATDPMTRPQLVLQRHSVMLPALVMADAGSCLASSSP
jgi:hypothetical protein